MAKVKEGDLVNGIKNYAQLYENQGLTYIIRNNTINQSIVRKDGSKGFLRNGKKGSPDLVMCIGGRFVGVECKVKGNKQSDLQKGAQAVIEKAGGLYWLVYTFDEFKREFDALVQNELPLV